MFKKLCKVLAGLAVIGAACAGIYYFLNKKADSEEEDEFMDDFDEDDDFELDDDLGEVSPSSREYVSLNPSGDAAASADQTSVPDEEDDEEEEEDEKQEDMMRLLRGN